MVDYNFEHVKHVSSALAELVACSDSAQLHDWAVIHQDEYKSALGAGAVAVRFSWREAQFGTIKSQLFKHMVPPRSRPDTHQRGLQATTPPPAAPTPPIADEPSLMDAYELLLNCMDRDSLACWSDQFEQLCKEAESDSFSNWASDFVTMKQSLLQFLASKLNGIPGRIATCPTLAVNTPGEGSSGATTSSGPAPGSSASHIEAKRVVDLGAQLRQLHIEADTRAGAGTGRRAIVACLDTETTGLYSDIHRVVQVAVVIADLAAQTEGGRARILKEWSVLVKPHGFVITNTEIHGITHERAVMDGIPIVAALEQLREMMADHGSVHAYNARFDRDMLDAEARRAGLGDEALPGVAWECVLEQARMQLPHNAYVKRSFKLQDVWERLGCGQRTDVNWHDALADTHALVDVMRALHLRNI